MLYHSQKSLLWLLCATILTTQPAFAAEKVEPKSVAPETIEKKTSGLTLENAIAKALAQSPRIQAYNSGVAGAKGEKSQAGAWTNPEISIGAENVGGGGAYKGLDSAEITYGVSQELPVGGKLSARKNIAGKGVEIASLEYQAISLDVIRDTTNAYMEAVAADETVRLAREQQELAKDVLKSVSTRVQAAAAPQIQSSRAEVELSSVTLALDMAMREREIARRNLATVMGEEQTAFTLNSKAFYTTAKPEAAALSDKLTSNPDIVKLDAALQQSKARLDLETANGIPNPRLNAGVRELKASGDRAFVVGLSLPIPVLNANRGNIEKARSDVSRTDYENRTAALNLNAELARAGQQMENAYLRAETLKGKILPSANKAFRLAREGYGLGRFPYLDVLDAQRSLFGVKQQHITALKEFHSAKATIERLTAVHLPEIQTQGEQK